MAPRTNAVGQPRPGIAVCATAATATVVVRTSPIASNPIGRTFARSSRSGLKNAAP